MREMYEIRYRFGPLERRGLIGSLRPGQMVVLAVTLFCTIVVVQALRSGLGLAIGAFILMLGGMGTFLPFGGRTLNEWTPVAASFLFRRARGRHRYRSGANQTGTSFSHGEIPVALPEAIGRVELLAIPFRGAELGVLADRADGKFMATIQARARSFVLLDPADKAHRLAAWASVISSLAREGSPISRVQWIERTVPDDRNGLGRYLSRAIDPGITLDAASLQSYLRLTEAAGPVTEQHELYVVLQLDAARAGRLVKQAGGRDTGACVVLARELETFARRLEQAEVEVIGALGPRALAKMIRLAFDPHARARLSRLASTDPGRQDGVSPRNAWPQSTETTWTHYRTNDVYHCTFWIAEWPRLDVGPEFLAPLLVQTHAMRSVSVTMEPVPPLKAMRAVGFAKTADVADEELRQRLGFLGTARRRNQAEAVARREQELADGHADIRFSGYVTVTADSPEALASACGEIEHAAAQARLELQRCDGEQDLAFTFALPLARGLK